MSFWSYFVCAGLVGFCSAVAIGAEETPPDLRGPYLGQQPPGREAQVFAPGLISVEGRYEYAVGFSPDGMQLLFTAQTPEGPSHLLHARVVDGRWSVPQPVSLSGGAKKAEMEAFFPTAAKSGAVYYTNLAKRKIYRALLDGDRVLEAADAGIAFGGHSFIAPDESFVLLDAEADDTRGKRDIYVAFERSGGGWTRPVNLGDAVNIHYSETCPSLSADGKYLFFGRYDEEGELSNIYWIESFVIDEAREASTR